MGSRPEGTVSFLFTDVEGSTALLAALGAEAYARELERHRLELRAAFARHGGSVVDTQGDAFFVAFPTATGACRAAVEGQAALGAGRIRVRMGLDTGEPLATDEGYVGMTVHRAARVAAAGHGGQILVSETTRLLVEDEVALRDLGLHRLKDLGEPRRLFQIGDDTFPPLKSLDRTNLPVPATAFIGRTGELHRLVELLGRDGVRLVTLTGAGGSGKTRLALQAAADVADAFPDGVIWVPLAAISDPGLVMSTVAIAQGAAPAGDASTLDGVAGALVDRKALLLLDNLEQVIECARDVAALVDRCPRLTVLATSREPLHVSAEHLVTVGALERSEAVALFGARAQAASESFEATGTVEDLCARLDDLPLAIELAAARVRTLSVDALLERIDGALDLLKGVRDADPRQQTLRATIAWSHDLLEDDERRAFRRLGAFVDGCTLPAAEAICDADLDLISSLVDKSLVKRRVDDAGDDRYWMLDTIHAFAEERLAESGEQELLRRRHAEWYAQHAIEIGEQSFVRMTGGFDAISRDFSEVRAALEYLEATGRNELLGATVAAACLYWYFVGGPEEGVRWTLRALELGPSDRLAAHLDNCLAALMVFTDRAEAKRLARAVIARNPELDDPLETTWAWTTIGVACSSDGDPDGAEAAYEQALQMAERHGLSSWVEGLSGNMALSALERGELERAESLAGPVTRSSSPTASAQAHYTLAEVALRRGDLTAARASTERAIRTARAEGPLSQLWQVRLIARIEASEGALARAAVLHGWVEEESRRRGSPPDAIDARHDEQIRTLLQAGLDPAGDAAARAAGAALTLDDAVAVALGERALPPHRG